MVISVGEAGLVSLTFFLPGNDQVWSGGELMQ